MAAISSGIRANHEITMANISVDRIGVKGQGRFVPQGSNGL